MPDLETAYDRARARLIEIGSKVDPAVAAKAAADALEPLRRRQGWSLMPVGLVEPDPKGADDLVERMISAVSVVSVNAGSALAHEAHVTERNALQSAELEFAETARMLDAAVPLVVAKLRAGRTVDMTDMSRFAVERIITATKPTPYRAAPVPGVVALVDSLAMARLEDQFMAVVASVEASYDKADLNVILRMFAKNTIRYAGDVLISRSDHLPVAA
jgi:hypothetical protein